ncbi:hypothetical protein ASC77_19785 [Nocardioides sp. Root1257]|uniref:NAD(P)/FAD-dependent oxidoreductase n=1 Tax=unclassified Nocardioides TaxID=2615069 RepID=UPI0006F82DB3|nr:MULTISPECIES: FAD-dependent oxidoreductase [unclassified Nocardioides]KQW45026.1 hypothetical protein ASC77_19785 [Nocardioides sp. Root1257]KRC45970.1 hypothetical protein ASE24_15435 [Nocardioides sp. Root224]
MSEGPLGDVVIAGGGLAAARTALALRSYGHDGGITVLSEEAEYPYDRPPLSKDVLLDRDASATCLLAPEDAAAAGIDVRLSHRVVALDLDSKVVVVENEPAVAYGSLVIATGTRARSLPIFDGVEGIQHLRTMADARAIRERLAPRSRIAIVGAGFIGLEVAAAARSLGCEVTVVEVAPTPLCGPLGPTVATWLQGWHTTRGVTFRCGVSVVAADVRASGTTLVLSDTTEAEADLVVVGVGVTRELDWMSSAGLRTHAGLVCDATGRSSAPDVYGAGDVVCLHDGADHCAPVQHWTAAADSAQRVAAAMSGLDLDDDVSENYFWSHQAELRLMSVGHAPPDVAPRITSGDLESGKFVAEWEVDGRVSAVLAANSPREFLQGRLAFRASSVALSGG